MEDLTLAKELTQLVWGAEVVLWRKKINGLKLEIDLSKRKRNLPHHQYDLHIVQLLERKINARRRCHRAVY